MRECKPRKLQEVTAELAPAGGKWQERDIAIRTFEAAFALVVPRLSHHYRVTPHGNASFDFGVIVIYVADSGGCGFPTWHEGYPRVPLPDA